MKNILLIADDLTGACDTGIKFQRLGWETTVLINGKSDIPKPEGEMKAVSVNTDTRSASPEDSFGIVRDILGSIEDRDRYYFYKKIDSVLRGNIVSELEAFFQVLHNEMVLVVPGVPENGRYVKDGVLYLGDREDPDTKIDGIKLLSEGGKRRCGSIGLSVIHQGKDAVIREIERKASEGEKILLADSWEDEDLRILAEALLELRDRCIPAGSAGLAQFLAEALARESGQGKGSPEVKLEDGALLIVVGSRHPVTVEQVRELKSQSDIETHLLEIEELGADNVDERAGKACEGIHAGAHVPGRIILLTTDDIYTCVDQQENLFSTNAFNRFIMEGLGKAAAIITEKIPVRSIIATGGDISAEVFRQLELDKILLCDEPIPGIVTGFACGTKGRCFKVATKSGGFGNRSAMAELCDYMKDHQET